MAADLAVQPMPEKLEGKPGEASTLLEVQAQSELQEQMAESGKGKHEEPETIAAEVEKPSGAKLAALLPYPDKFHAAAKLAGAPLHEETGLDDAHRLMLYALFRQATDGPCNDPRPSVFDPAAAAKHMAYSRLGNMNPLEAMFLYARTLEEEKPDIWDAYKEEDEEGVNDSKSGTVESNEAVENGKDATTEAKGEKTEANESSEDVSSKIAVETGAEIKDGPGSKKAGQEDTPRELKVKDAKALLIDWVDVHVSPKKQQQIRMPNVPRDMGKLDALFSDALQLNRLPSREAANKHLAALKPDLQSLVRRMIFVVELLSNQADLGRKMREADALRKALNVPGGVDREIGIKVRSLVGCGELVIGVIERELADWTAAISEEGAAGPVDMIPDRGIFGFKHLPQLAKLRAAWEEQLSDWQAMKEEVPEEEGGQFSIYNMLFTNVAS